MAKIVPGRYTAKMEGSYVVFIIGMRINQLLAVHKWLPVARAMGGMVEELYQNPELGFLGSRSSMSLRTITQIQYWRSFEHLEKYARHAPLHLMAWKKFNQAVGADGSVGIYHETYLVEAGHYECVYVNMPVFGLGEVGELVPATGKRESARQRINKG
ncbi:DUF4188 domain-containing protein [Brevibacillus agri]|uniref:DUF4188 domain-containing protein n=1 Tax=Brevibacillus TaxID=55080 RepID=UPI000271B32F|nr:MULTISPECIES: DUF4188 domain-containing protein [Brevibacillus]EJL43197.1 hypothetical protein PMI08_02741 [Brevibacillus sp. CF112]MDR9504886.1 DUF4188 domain-containing protein [Brevibacillus agri]MED1641691.1 DUF4188 domain-containing protein [Brevibacillus agri]MED1654311.1 DUF4188 domain-containing protein [Brevibacillus agri]MED1686405.1 DUF4188 domain-containing protein [Brevibacillus agri]